MSKKIKNTIFRVNITTLILFAIFICSLMLTSCNSSNQDDSQIAHEAANQENAANQNWNTFTSEFYKNFGSEGPALTFKYSESWNLTSCNYSKKVSENNYSASITSPSNKVIELNVASVSYGGYEQIVSSEIVGKVENFNRISYTSINPTISKYFSECDTSEADRRKDDLVVVKVVQNTTAGQQFIYRVVESRYADISQANMQYFNYYGCVSFVCKIENTEPTKGEESEIISILSSISQVPTEFNHDLDDKAYEKLSGFWETPASGGGGRVYYLYIKPNNVALEGETVAKAIYPQETWIIDSIEDNGDIKFHVSGYTETKNYLYVASEQKITSTDRKLKSVDDGVTELPFYMTKGEVPDDYNTWK